MPKKWYSDYENAECLECGKIEKHMIRIGNLIFCMVCADSVFNLSAKERDQNKYHMRLRQHARKEKTDEY